MRIIKLLLLFVLFGVSTLAALLGSLWLDHRRGTIIPAPTGPFPVSRKTYIWRDTQVDTLAPAPGSQREIVSWIWYPAAVEWSATNAAEYMPASWRKALNQQRGMLVSRFLTRDLSKVRTHTARDADLPKQPRSFPVVIMRSGLAALTLQYSALAEDLASHGYVVVGFDVPYRSSVVVYPDGRLITRSPSNNADAFPDDQQHRILENLLTAWTADVGFVLSQLERLNTSDSEGGFVGRLDLSRVGIFGHSLGGATAAQFCHDDLRCKAGIDIDGALGGNVAREGLRQPFLFILSDHGDETDAETMSILATIRSVNERLPNRPDVLVIRGANHFGFSDDGALLKSPMLRGLLRQIGVVRIDGTRQLGLTKQIIHTFFDVHLKNDAAAKLQLLSTLPEMKALRPDS